MKIKRKVVCKTLEAILRGYIYFKVNDKVFYRYNTALAYRESITGNVDFIGLHIFKGWVGFYFRAVNIPWELISLTEELKGYRDYFEEHYEMITKE